MWHDEDVDPSPGALLIATPQLVDPNFFRTVVLLLSQDPEGFVGLVLNRRTEERIDHHLPDWSERASDSLVRYGGPVEPEVAIGLGVSDDGLATGIAGLVMLDLESVPNSSDLPDIRIYSGYSGWGRGQLESEIAMGSWYVVEGEPGDPFVEPDSMWSVILRRQSGHLALMASFPDDVTLN